ncbi:hypothetical protein D9615_004146 [Tricholomella constricta]|uniref:Uncharacterized protein n=1 Tax=Tricholomella constricta TaxID=117010 RepID=A0A8H5HCR7_9AGAR|nr:hypothetical protein D9615_004146 [Tricholomella constricta]
MSVSIDIVPIADTLDMYGDADISSAYSLSGHVSISVSSPYSIFERRRTARIMLHSITLTFEGQTEIHTPQTGYCAVRLCSVTREIAPCEPVEMSNEGHEDSDVPCIWNVVFDLPIPGWLPQSASYGVEEVGVRYGLFAEAKFSVIDDSQSNPWSLATLCSSFRSRAKNEKAHRQIRLRRLMCHPEDETGTAPLQSTITYLVNTNVAPDGESKRLRFPNDVLSKIHVLATVPEHADMESHGFPLVIRMRTKDLAAEECKRIQVSSVSANVVQKERYRTRVPSEYMRRYPLPPRPRQPPHEPLRDPHPISFMYDSGLGVFCAMEENASRSFSLLPPNESGVYTLPGNTYPFENDADTSAEAATWYTLESSVPFVHQAPDGKELDWAGPSLLLPTISSPLVNVAHEVRIELTCTYDIPGGSQVATERLAFAIPLSFAFFAPDTNRCITPPPVHSTEETTQSGSPKPSLPAPMPYAPNLPAYSQLFDCNGDRKIDYTVPLPLYTPRSSGSASSSTANLNVDGDETEPLLST